MKKEAEAVYRDRTIYLISRIREKANRLIARELAGHNLAGIVPTHGDILVSLFLQPGLSMKSLAEIIDRDKSTVTALVDKLVRLGYVEKKPDPNDNRINLVCLTSAGRALMPDFLDISRKLQARVYKNLNRKEQATLIDLLAKINKDW
jgi:MarR family transcriptional regulator, organic hydroperoxide resistance regulator